MNSQDTRGTSNTRPPGARSTREADFVERMNRMLWQEVEGAQPAEIPPRGNVHSIHRTRGGDSLPPGAKGMYDLAVALAIHAANQPPGPQRERSVARCLDSLEQAVAAGHPGPLATHKDFDVVADRLRFRHLARYESRKGA